MRVAGWVHITSCLGVDSFLLGGRNLLRHQQERVAPCSQSNCGSLTFRSGALRAGKLPPRAICTTHPTATCANGVHGGVPRRAHWGEQTVHKAQCRASFTFSHLPGVSTASRDHCPSIPALLRSTVPVASPFGAHNGGGADAIQELYAPGALLPSFVLAASVPSELLRFVLATPLPFSSAEKLQRIA